MEFARVRDAGTGTAFSTSIVARMALLLDAGHLLMLSAKASYCLAQELLHQMEDLFHAYTIEHLNCLGSKRRRYVQ
jgi:hypothetical protein